MVSVRNHYEIANLIYHSLFSAKVKYEKTFVVGTTCHNLSDVKQNQINRTFEVSMLLGKTIRKHRLRQCVLLVGFAQLVTKRLPGAVQSTAER